MQQVSRDDEFGEFFDQMRELISKTIANRYRVDAFIGRGGMAEVYKVWDSHRSTYLAMKVLYEDLAIDRVFMRRFRREAQNLAKLQHPNIVRFYGIDQKGRLAYMLMDFIEGETLKHKIFDAEGPLSIDQIQSIMRSVCGALQFAHNEGLIHCDVKPGNIMIDKTGRVMVTDFGIARVTDAATATMVGMGTPAYMAPEQARGLDPVPQTDIYAMGVVLFEMLTGGERPFTGEQAQTTGSTSEKVRWEQMHLEPPSPRKYNQNIASALEAVVLKCLEKDPSDRYARPLELVQAMDMAIADSSSLQPVGQNLPFVAPTIKTEAGIEDGESLEPESVTYPPKEDAPPIQTKPPTSRKWVSLFGVFGIFALIMASLLFYMQRQPILIQTQTAEVEVEISQSSPNTKSTENFELVLTKNPTKTRIEPADTKAPTKTEVKPSATKPPTKTRLPPTRTKPPTKVNTPTPSGPLFLELDQNYHCRGGPGADYELLRDFLSGTRLEIFGKDYSGSWFLIAINDPSTRKKLCWIHGGVVLGDPARLSTCTWYGDGYTADHTCQGP